MDDNTYGARPRRRGWPPARHGRRRAGTLTAAVAGAALLATACGGSSAGADTFQGGTYTQSLAYAKCMRSHGVLLHRPFHFIGRSTVTRRRFLGTGAPARPVSEGSQAP